MSLLFLKFKVGLVTDASGIDDMALNESAWKGIQAFARYNDIEGYDYLQSINDDEFYPNLKNFIKDYYAIVFGVGFFMADAVREVALENPYTQLAIVDMVIQEDPDDEDSPLVCNVANIVFAEEEGSFLVGVVAGLHTKTNKVGFLGGVNLGLTKKFENGFKAGVKSVNPNVEIIIQYADTFVDIARGQKVAANIYNQGADIIYHAAGDTGLGVFTEAKQRKKDGENVWVIGVDYDQHAEGMPENVTLTSMVKNVNVAVYDVAKKTKQGAFPGGEILSYGIAGNGVGLAATTDNVTKEALLKVDEFKKRIIDGKIIVPKTDAEFKSSEFNKVRQL
ncbi:BMP family ABC transporter substrate-binding protein [Lottiidibacillus patelloidae]|uniref:BMP family ABC transporter substrate-binding protein n=1 Tax=Lottiidibacillus patelloidae TaxID=2670334 RepID=A0A263BRY1_9BACI|nr:BMP family ABC transporter substrate-binding protein [Lottiidibacillus patelloidae]OZM56127.1 BMP family ABC transporter substrate-binding protein [Lottiidibacillus patelloidae]